MTPPPYTRHVPAPGPAEVLVPVKAFHLAKARLAAVLDPDQRVALARSMAAQVLLAAAPLPVRVVCDDETVAEWARAHGAEVEWTPGLGLNGAVQEASRRLAARGVARVVVAHADLPFAERLAELAVAAPDEAVVVSDRREAGTNVLSVPTDAGFVFAYGAGSLQRHLAEAERRGLRVRRASSVALGWDVDEPGDLDVPDALGAGSAMVVGGRLYGPPS
jgi:2-phospho-L-lactate guanylyltransferase